MRRSARTASWLLFVGLCACALHIAGTGRLAPPPASAGGLLDWVDARTPFAAAVGLVRLAAEATAWYVLAVSVVRVSAAWSGGAALVRVADALTLPVLRGVLSTTMGVGLVVTPTLAPAVSPGAAVAGASLTGDDVSGARVGGTATMRPVTQAPPEVGRPTGTATMRPHISARDETEPDDGDPDDTVPAPAGPAARAPVASTWTVDRGECFWSIAADIVAQHRGRAVSDADVAQYWRRLIEVNRSRLVDPDDPDLLHPGQVLEVPAPDPA